MLNILYEDNHIIVVVKPYNIPTNLDDSKDDDLLSLIKDYIKVKYHKPNNVYLGLVHRLDRPVSGVMVFAKTSKAASRLSNQLRLKQIKKEYLAVVEDNNLKSSDTFRDKLLKNKKTNTTKVDIKGKDSELSYQVIFRKNNYALVKIQLKTGRSHQIRVQFSSRNHAIYGDQRYNKNAIVGQQINLFAYKLSFYHPTTKELMTFQAKPDYFLIKEDN